MKKKGRLDQSAFRINSLYFGFLFFATLFLHIFHVCLIDLAPFRVKIPFIIDAATQVTIEMMTFIILFSLLAKYCHKSLAYIFITFTFFIFLAHLADFFLIRLFGMSVWQALDLMFDETLANFIEMLRASNVSFLSWILGAFALIAIFSLGVFFFHLTEAWIKRHHFRFSPRFFSLFLGLIPLSLACFDKVTVTKTSVSAHDYYKKLLPWKLTFFSPQKVEIPFVLKPLKSEEETLKAIDQIDTPVHKPNIYIFIIESLRADFITQEIAPHMKQFKDKHLSFDTAVASANATQVSWFSLFHSKMPLYWTKKYSSNWSSGSPALYLLKKNGYKIHTYSSAELAYYHMDELVFGKNRFLADSIDFFPYGGKVMTHQSDTKAVEKLCLDMDQNEKEGHVYITLLDSTHFGYSWPRDNPDRFTPVQEGIDYLNSCYYKGNLETIKNRYRNSVYFIDSLIGKFLNSLNDPNALIVITGDHGEEYCEHGHLFHTSNLSIEQTEVPLYYKLGNTTPTKSLPKVTSHIDIFPTLLHHIFGDEVPLDFLDGESIFKENRKPFSLTAKYNAGRNPYEFFIHTGTHKWLLKCSNEKDPFHSKALYQIAFKTRYDVEVPPSEIPSKSLLPLLKTLSE